VGTITLAGKPIERPPEIRPCDSVPLSKNPFGVPTGISAFSAISASDVFAVGVSTDPMSTVIEVAVCTLMDSAGSCSAILWPPESTGRSSSALRVPAAIDIS
jgi:hypothetical protein